jgi:homoserine O-succinyltransferase
MPLMIEGRVPSRWAERAKSRSVVSIDTYARSAECLSLALINNMPDPALEDTELQFFELLDIASGEVPVYLKLYSLTGVPRADSGQRHLNRFYFDFDDLWHSRLDGVLVTGTEPHCDNLRDEPYWRLLADVFDWAERSTSSTILSCLAAHASVLHFDGIKRHRLPDKQFGVFESHKNCDHLLTSQAAERLHFPHSRWNEVRAEELTAAGYVVLTESKQAGVDLFVRKTRTSMFVHFQGHPEYGAQTLLKEYRRDIKRFLRGERDTYPSTPQGYFEEAASQPLKRFRERALSERREQVIEFFPESVVSCLQNTWQASATCMYRSWLRFLASRKAETARSASFARGGPSRSACLNSETA